MLNNLFFSCYYMFKTYYIFTKNSKNFQIIEPKNNTSGHFDMPAVKYDIIFWYNVSLSKSIYNS